MQRIKQSYFVSDLLAIRAPVLHGFSTRVLGDMRDVENQNVFLDTLGIHRPLFLVRQIHGDTIVEPTKKNDIPKEADGIVCSPQYSFAIGIITADCVPILLADMKGKSVAVVHAGWKGTLKGIITKVVERMRDMGTKREDIIASIGPRIGSCCYSIKEERARLFQSVFGDDSRVCYSMRGEWFLDIGYANLQLLQKVGVSRNHIDAIPMCTSCQVDTFYSYRKDKNESFGEQIAVICKK